MLYQRNIMLSPEEITSLTNRLDIHRLTVQMRLKQLVIFGAAYVPPYVLHDIRENREGIQKIKNMFRAADVEIEDREDDFDQLLQSELVDQAVAETKSDQTQTVSNPEELLEIWQQAEEAYNAQDWERAEPLLVEVATVNPRYREVQRLLSRTRKYLVLLADYRRLCGLEDNQWQEAKVGFEFIRRESPSFPDKLHLLDWIAEQEWAENQYYLAKEYMEDGDSASVVDILTPIVQLHSNHQHARQLLEEANELEVYRVAQQHKSEVAAQQLYAKHLQLQEQAQQREEERRQQNVRIVVMVIAILFLCGILVSCIDRLHL